MKGLDRTLVVLAVLGAIAAPSASASTHGPLILSGHAANNTVVVHASGIDSGTYRVNGGRATKFSGIRSLKIQGHGGHDVCQIINPRGSVFAPSGGITCAGGNRTGRPRRGALEITGGRAGASSYTPGRVGGTGTIVHRLERTRQVIRFSGLAPVTDTVPGPFTFTDPMTNDVVGVISADVAAGKWTIESLSHPGTFESDTFSAKTALTINATGMGDSVVLEPASPEAGLTQLNVNSATSIAAVGANVGGSTPVALNAGTTVTGAGPSPQLLAGATSAVAPAGIGPLATQVSGFGATSSGGSIELHNTGALSLTGALAAGATTLSSTGTLTNDGHLSGAQISLNGAEIALAGGTVTGTAVTLAPLAAVPAVLGGTAAGALNISQASLGTVTASALTVGGPATGRITIAGPVLVGAAKFTLEGSGGFTATGSGAIAANGLQFTDDGAIGRPWTIGPSSVADGIGLPIPYAASSLAVNSGSGTDSFDVTPSSTTPMHVDGGASAGDALTFEAGGAVVAGAAGVPQGDLTAAGKRDVLYTSMGSVRVVNPGQVTTTTRTVSAPTPAPVCSLIARSSTVTIGRGRKPKPSAFALLATCSQTAKVSLAGTLSVTPAAKRGSHKKPKTTKTTLKSSTVTIKAGSITTIALKIPTSAQTALRSGAKESLTVTLTATAGLKRARAGATVKKLIR